MDKKKWYIVGIIMLVISIVCLILRKFVISAPDWFTMFNIVLTIISMFFVIFYSVRIAQEKNK